jgi:diguanylate cyclase (GGDEF)-like protein
MHLKKLYQSHLVWFLLAMLMVPLFLWLSHQATQQLVQSKASLKDSYKVLFLAEQLRAGIEMLETARRGYVLTSQEQYLEPYHYAKRQLPEDLEALKQLTVDNASMQQNLQAIEPVINSLTRMITDDVRHPSQDGKAIASTMSEVKNLLDEARQLLEKISSEERRLLAIRTIEAEDRQKDLTLTLMIMGLSILAVLIFTFIKLFLEVSARKRNELSLIETKAENELTVHNLSLMGELSSLLQACSKTEESLEVINRYAQRMLNADSGVLYLFRDSRNLLEQSARWGEEPKSKPTFEPDDCWALRRGEIHLLDQDEHNMPCTHLHEDGVMSSLCVPIVAQGTVLGILHFEHHQRFSSLDTSIAHNLASQIALALASLKLRETLRNLSVRDPLTSLFNRRYMEESLHREIAAAERKGYQLGLVMMDVDHFKRFNDTFGHDAGDVLLREVANILKLNSRVSDIACRFGGEEFVIIYPETSPEFVMQRAELLRQAIAAMQLKHFGRSLGEVTASFGVASYPEHGTTIQELLKAADEALYRAKGEGRNRCLMADNSTRLQSD